MKRLAPGLVFTAILATACNLGREAANDPIAASSTPASVTIQARVAESPHTSLPELSPSPSPSPTPSPQDVHPTRWYARVTTLDPATRARMKYSWHSGCPIPIKHLRLIRMSYLGFDREVHMGEMVVHRSVTNGVVRAFHTMFEAKYPIRRMRLVDDYRGDDDRSMAADNTSSFNCRKVTGGSDWSEHAYGWAIDINPVENPYVSSSGRVLPPSGATYADRSLHARGMIHRGDVVYSAFKSIGWGWGGNWRSFQDYQHFSATAR